MSSSSNRWAHPVLDELHPILNELHPLLDELNKHYMSFIIVLDELHPVLNEIHPSCMRSSSTGWSSYSTGWANTVLDESYPVLDEAHLVLDEAHTVWVSHIFQFRTNEVGAKVAQGEWGALAPRAIPRDIVAPTEWVRNWKI